MFAAIAVFWAIAEAYRRRALYRKQILLSALGVPVAFAGIGERLLHLLARAKSPVWPIVTGLTFFVLYLTCAFGIVVWAHRAKIEPDPQGFPIEPTHPKPPDDSES